MRYRKRACAAVARVVGISMSVAVCLAVNASEASAQLEVTSLKGVVLVGDQRLSIHSQIPANETLTLQGDARCALLLSNTAVLQLSNRARVSFGRLGAGGGGRIEISEGDLKATVGPRPTEDLIEIHTPASIVTLRHSVAHVAVDPEAGDTTIRSLERQVRVSGRHPSKARFLSLKAGEEVTVRRGQAPGEIHSFSRDGLEKTSACIDELGFHLAAVDSDRDLVADGDPAIVASADVPTEGLPLGTAVSRPSALITALSKAGVLEEVCDPVSCNPKLRRK